MMAAQQGFSNAYIPDEWTGKYFRIALSPGYGYIVGYVQHFDSHTNFAQVRTTQLITLSGVYPVHCAGILPRSAFAPEVCDWHDMASVITEYQTGQGSDITAIMPPPYDA